MPAIESGLSDGWFPSASRNDLNEHGKPAILGRFAWKRRLNIAASKEADEEVYRNVLMVEHKIIGDDDVSTNKVDKTNFNKWRSRFPDAWKAFKEGEPEPDGLSLRTKEDGAFLLEALGPEKIEALRIEGIRTYEDLAGTDDATCQRLGFGSKKLRDQAKELLEQRSRPKRGRPPKTAERELASVGA